MKLTESPFGKYRDREIIRYTIDNQEGVRISLLEYGANLSSVVTPDSKGVPGEITLSFDSLDEYISNRNFFGAAIGRYGNRIALGRFVLNGTTYILDTNNGPNHLHGGIEGFDRLIWDAAPFMENDRAGVLFSLVSPDEDQGYPGTLFVKLKYTLTDSGELFMEYEAESDRDTIINLTNHTFWNLTGAGSGSIHSHIFQSPATGFIPVDENSIPLGDIQPVDNTPFDFRKAKTFGLDFGKLPIGYDHCMVLPKPWGKIQSAGTVISEKSGRQMEVSTDQPGFQLYTAYYMKEISLAANRKADQFGAFCLETQNFPDAPNQPGYPSPVLKPGNTYIHKTRHKFSRI